MSSPRPRWIRLLRWWFAGLLGRGQLLAGLRLVVAGVAVGLASGWLMGKNLHIVTIAELTLPRPVVPAAPGTHWAKVLTTGYCPCTLCCGPFATGVTSIGHDVRLLPFGIAAAPAMLPYRLWLEVPGYGRAEIDDTGGAMRQDAGKGVIHLDLRFVTHAEALRWGRRSMYLALPDGLPLAQAAPPRPAAPAATTPSVPAAAPLPGQDRH